MLSSGEQTGSHTGCLPCKKLYLMYPVPIMLYDNGVSTICMSCCDKEHYLNGVKLQSYIHCSYRYILCHIECWYWIVSCFTTEEKKVREKSGECHSPSQTPREGGNRQNQTSANRTNIRKELRLALSSPSEVIAMQKDWKTQEQNNTR